MTFDEWNAKNLPASNNCTVEDEMRRAWSAAFEAQADEIDRLRACAGRVVAAFETLGRTKDAAGLLVARARCESVMLELQSLSKI